MTFLVHLASQPASTLTSLHTHTHTHTHTTGGGVTMVTMREVVPDLAEDHGLSYGDDTIDITQSLKFSLLVSTQHIELVTSS